MGDPIGIPGHASFEGPYKWLQERLRELGARFEAEGDTTRIHVRHVIIEAKEDPEHGSIVQVQAPLPVPGDDPSDHARNLYITSIVVSSLRGDIVYQVEEIAPGYPLLRAIIPYIDAWSLVRDLVTAVRQSIVYDESNHINQEG